MKSKLEILEDIHMNIQSAIENDCISVDATDELNRIDSDILKAMEKERDQEQVELFNEELGK